MWQGNSDSAHSPECNFFRAVVCASCHIVYCPDKWVRKQKTEPDLSCFVRLLVSWKPANSFY